MFEGPSGLTGASSCDSAFLRSVCSGLLDFPASSLTFPRHRVGLRGVSDRALRPPDLLRTFKVSLWHTLPCFQGASLGFRDSPSPSLFRTSTPGANLQVSFLRPPQLHLERSRSAFAVSHGLDGLLRAGAARILQRASVLGFTLVSAPLWSSLSPGVPFAAAFPRMLAPFGVFPSSIAALVSPQATAFLSLPFVPNQGMGRGPSF